MRLTVSHTTTYQFSPPKRGVVQSHRLTPARTAGQAARSWSVSVPGATQGAAFRDGAGDWIDTVSLAGPVSELSVEVTGVVETSDTSGVLRDHRETVPPMAYLRETRATHVDHDLAVLSRDAVAELPEDDALGRAHALSEAVAARIAYRSGSTLWGTSAAEALAQGEGVCQDQAHALIAVAIAAGLPARYVAGYLYSANGDLAADEATHAWAEIWIDRLGWVGFDPANGCCPDDRYIRLGSGHDAVGAAPIRSVSEGAGDEHLDVSVSILPDTAQSQSQQ
ncbi:Transglutaminase-like enzyme, putative cysteine protease [Tranquillimonas rosea]|uniref:Transglutaminase-like enzyme, putative cysteine protease n=1 Tax=Tranquillimonas rosea TaxID=641238 RepID=A0A1H9V217_9RHOB|nr:transglutaminase family protein [Tranquillimonas rosea]SES15414.1 Transglutaminase-like enzyme, putative cysteine protease [Tranquillimonas rosea]